MDPKNKHRIREPRKVRICRRGSDLLERFERFERFGRGANWGPPRKPARSRASTNCGLQQSATPIRNVLSRRSFIRPNRHVQDIAKVDERGGPSSIPGRQVSPATVRRRAGGGDRAYLCIAPTRNSRRWPILLGTVRSLREPGGTSLSGRWYDDCRCCRCPRTRRGAVVVL